MLKVAMWVIAALIVAGVGYKLAFDTSAAEETGTRWTDGTNAIGTPYTPR